MILALLCALALGLLIGWAWRSEHERRTIAYLNDQLVEARFERNNLEYLLDEANFERRCELRSWNRGSDDRA